MISTGKVGNRGDLTATSPNQLASRRLPKSWKERDNCPSLDLSDLDSENGIRPFLPHAECRNRRRITILIRFGRYRYV